MGYKSRRDSPEVSRLREIQQEMLGLLGEAEDIVTRRASTMTAARAKSYWIPEVKVALVKEHQYLASCMFCMDDTIKEMSKRPDGSDDDECGSDTDDSEY